MNINHASSYGGKRFKGILAEGSAEHPLVTVVTALFNGRPYVQGCLESVLQQDYPNIEHIVMDGGSTDGTLDVLRSFEDRIALWKSEPDRGIYDAWNKALREARGEWICFLGIDDEFLPGAIRAYMELAAKNPQAEYLSSQARWVHASGKTRLIGEPWSWPAFSKKMTTAHVGSMHRRSLFDAVGEYDVTHAIVGDYELLLRPRHNLKAAFMPVPTVMMRAGGTSDSSAALVDAMRAKVQTGGRSAWLARAEYWIARLKHWRRSRMYRKGSNAR